MKNRITVIIGCCFALAGCATAIDTDAIPAAEAQLSLAIAQCNGGIPNHVITSVHQYVECHLAADRTAMVAIKLKDMTLFEAYSARMRLIGQQADANQITPDQMTTRFDQARADLDNQIIASYQNDMQKRARMSAALAAMGQSMERAADRQAYIDAHQQNSSSLSCISSKLGPQIVTNCN